MNRILAVFVLLVLFGSCDNYYKKECLTCMLIQFDSSGVELRDTLSVKEKFYDSNDKVVKIIEETLFADYKSVIDFEYNNKGRIEKEIVWTSYDSLSFDADYFYTDNLLVSISSANENDDFKFSSNMEFLYYPNGETKQITTTVVNILKEFNDTSQTKDIEYFNLDGTKYKSTHTEFRDSTRNKSSAYTFENNLIKKIEEFDFNDSLLSTTIKKYTFDKDSNWIKVEFVMDSNILHRCDRQINY